MTATRCSTRRPTGSWLAVGRPASCVRTPGSPSRLAGIDASNLEAGTVIPLPPDPDGAARDLRTRLEELTGVRLGLIVSDTAGRAWRIGQTDIAIGVSGIAPLLSFAGVEDSYGNLLAVTAPAIADELAGVADLVGGKLDGHPVVVVRGLPAEWFGPHDEGAASLIRDEDGDLFGLGARDAVLAAVSRGELPRGFPVPEPDDDLIALARAGADLSLADVTVAADGSLEVRALSEDGAPEAYVEAGALAERLRDTGPRPAARSRDRGRQRLTAGCPSARLA